MKCDPYCPYLAWEPERICQRVDEDPFWLIACPLDLIAVQLETRCDSENQERFDGNERN